MEPTPSELRERHLRSRRYEEDLVCEESCSLGAAAAAPHVLIWWPRTASDRCELAARVGIMGALTDGVLKAGEPVIGGLPRHLVDAEISRTVSGGIFFVGSPRHDPNHSQFPNRGCLDDSRFEARVDTVTPCHPMGVKPSTVACAAGSILSSPNRVRRVVAAGNLV